MLSFLLDAGIGSVSSVLWILFIISLLVILIEAVVMFLFKLNNFGKTLLHSFFVNIVSTIVGYIMISYQDSNNDKISTPGQWLIFFGATVIIEGLLLMLLYTKTSKSRLWLITVVMNLVSYLFLYLASFLL